MNATINSLTPYCLQKIVCHLEDRDVRALAISSKNMYNIAKSVLESRDQELERILTSSFKVYRRFNIKALKEADTYPIGEIHGMGIPEQADLMKHLAMRGNLWVVLEGLLFSQELVGVQKDRFMEKYKLNPTLKDNIHVTGWDTSDNQEMLKRSAEVDQEIEEAVFAINKKLMSGEIANALDAIAQINAKETLGNEKKLNIYAETFPERTKEMCRVLAEIELKAKSSLADCNKRVSFIFIAGRAHLDETSVDKRRFNLDSLYEQLDKHKAVILVPH